MSGSTKILFGDIHNHNAYGYGVGSLERSIDIARTHLDFFAFTGHSSWHDMKPMEGGREQHWLKGFERLKEGWTKVQDLIANADKEDEFSAFLGFEWHSSFFGDQCVIFPDDHQPIIYPNHLQKLRNFCIEKQALMIPHHLAYPPGHRGVNWEVFDECCTPVVEIFSEHGNSEDDRGPYAYFNHSMGPRETSQTVKAALARGVKFGFIASSDSHNGFPGAYGEGLLAVHSQGLDRASIINAINRRHTYALTGERILVHFSVDGAIMGSCIRTGTTAEVFYDVCCPDEIEIVEIIQDGNIVFRDFPTTKLDLQTATAEPFHVRLEWGWGPWGDLALERIADWAFDIKISGGKILDAIPCLKSGPFDEHRRHQFDLKSQTELGIISYSSRQGAYRQNPNQSVILKISGGSSTSFELKMNKPIKNTSTVLIKDLFDGSVSQFTGPFPKEAYQWHRLVPVASSRISGKTEIQIPQPKSNIYLRVKQQNGHIAWASPIFINYPFTD